jgi:hypothetical protein
MHTLASLIFGNDGLYGKVGGPTRLDFTCIGHAVNLAAGLESIGAQLDRQIDESRATSPGEPDRWPTGPTHYALALSSPFVPVPFQISL